MSHKTWVPELHSAPSPTSRRTRTAEPFRLPGCLHTLIASSSRRRAGPLQGPSREISVGPGSPHLSVPHLFPRPRRLPSRSACLAAFTPLVGGARQQKGKGLSTELGSFFGRPEAGARTNPDVQAIAPAVWQRLLQSSKGQRRPRLELLARELKRWLQSPAVNHDCVA